MSSLKTECACENKNRLTCITFNSTLTAQRTLTGTANTAGSYYTFNFPANFTVMRHKACTISITSGSIAYDTSNASYGDTAAAIDLVTDIPVQGLCMNMPFFPDGQVVQASIDIGDGTTTDHSGDRVFQCNQPTPTRFRCQALPDRISVFMLRTEFGVTPPVMYAPDHLNLTLEIEFDEI